MQLYLQVKSLSKRFQISLGLKRCILKQKKLKKTKQIFISTIFLP